MPGDELIIKTEVLRDKKIAIIHITGNLDAHSFEKLQEVVESTFESDNRNIVLNMGDVPYMSSAGAGVLIGAMAEADRCNGKLVIMSLRPNVLQVFEMLGIKDIFALANDRDSAIASF